MKTDYYALAKSMRERGIPFEQAYEMIFGRPPQRTGGDRPTETAADQGTAKNYMGAVSHA